MNYIDNLTDLSIDELAEIWNALNTWNWHVALGKEPYNWYELLDYSKEATGLTKKDIITPICKHIESKIGKKECLRWHHKRNLNRTDVEFEIWWSKREQEESLKESKDIIVNESIPTNTSKYEIERLMLEVVNFHRDIFINKCLDEREYDLLRKLITADQTI